MGLGFLTKKDLQLIKRAFKYAKPYKFRMFLSFILTLSSIASGLIHPLFWAKLITNMFEKDYITLRTNIICIAIIFVLQMGIDYLQSYNSAFLNENIMYDLKKDMYDKILNLPIKAFDETRAGEFISRMQGDSSTLSEIITSQLINAIIDVLRVIIIGIVVFSISIPLSFVILACFPLSFINFSYFGKKLNTKRMELAVLNDSYFSGIQQTVVGIRDVKGLGLKKFKMDSFIKIAATIKNRSIGMGIIHSISQLCSQSVNFCSQILITAIGGLLVINGKLIMEYYISFTSYSQQFSVSLINLTRLNSTLQQAIVSLTRIFDLMDNLNYSMELFGKKNIKNLTGNIQFRNVCFEYNANEPVLKEISINIKANTKVAIVGKSGSGKSTLLNLLLRFYNPTSGEIMIDNIDISELSESSLRNSVSVVRQEPFIFNMSINDNLKLSKPDANAEDIISACKSAYIHDFISSLPEGYNTILGENGINLSGGQKQRLAIARALLKNTRIILFDEATSSLDNESQYYIKQAIDTISSQHTIIMIAHRLITIIEADDIIVIDEGKIAGHGKHENLINNNEVYQKLYKSELDIINQNKAEDSNEKHYGT